MFLIGEIIKLDTYGQVEVTAVGLNSITVEDNKLGELHIPLGAHDYRKFLMLEPLAPEIVHYAPVNGKYVYGLHSGARIHVKRYGSRYQWAIAGKQASALQVWKYVYGLEG